MKALAISPWQRRIKTDRRISNVAKEAESNSMVGYFIVKKQHFEAQTRLTRVQKNSQYI